MKRFHIWKRLITCLLVAALCLSVFALASCEDSKKDPGTDKEQEQAKNDDKQNQAGDDKNDDKTDDNKGGDNNNDNGGEKKDDETPTAPVVLTEEEWNAAVNFVGVENLTYSVEQEVNGYKSVTVMRISGNKLSTITTINGVEEANGIAEKTDDGNFFYENRYGVWTKEKAEAEEDYAYNYNFSKKFIDYFAGHFSEFTFDGKDTYTCNGTISYTIPAELAGEALFVVLKDIRVTFNADKKVTRVECLATPSIPGAGTFLTVTTFDYTPITITIPTPTTVKVTEAEWKAALSSVLADSVTFSGEVNVGDRMSFVEVTVSGNAAKLCIDGEETYIQKDGGKYFEYRKVDGKWQKAEVSRPELMWVLTGVLSQISANFSDFEYDGINEYRAKETFPGQQEGEGYTGWVIQKGCEVYFNTEKKVSGMEFNSNFYDSNSSKYYYAHLSIDYSPVSVTLPAVE